MTDETYLESFIENISTLPSEIRRNLELMKDMDKSCSLLTAQLRKEQQEYIVRAEEIVMQLEIAKMPDGRQGIKVPNAENEIIIPTSEEMIDFVADTEAMDKILALHGEALQQAEEKVAIADQTYALVDSTVRRLDKDLTKLETLLKSTGGYDAGGAKPDDLAAIQVTPGSPDWILAKVISHDPETGMYKLSDEDVESNKIFHLPESQVVVLGHVEKLSRGDIVYAVYPDTTSFYQATVVQAPRKVSGGGAFVMVNFLDDGDENGITHDKAVLLKHVMRPPHGATVIT